MLIKHRWAARSALLAFVLGPLAIGPGCQPADGDEGGKCIGCNGQCHDGLVCDDSNTCVRPSPTSPPPPSSPGCWVPEETSCGPAQEFACEDPLTPADGDAALTCATLFNLGMLKEYCCAPPGTCFAPGATDAGLGCAGGQPGWRYFCMGASAPSLPDAVCSMVDVPEAGTAAHEYCCSTNGGIAPDSGVGDVGGN